MSRRKKQAAQVEKFHYFPSDIHYSSGWVTEQFRLAEQQRKIDREQSKEDNAKALGVIWELIDELNCVSFWAFLGYIYKNKPELKVLVVGNHSLIRDAIYSRSNDIAAGFVDMDYNEVCNLLKVANENTLELEDSVKELRKELRYKTDNQQKLEERILELETMLEQSNKFAQYMVQKNNELFDLLQSEPIL